MRRGPARLRGALAGSSENEEPDGLATDSRRSMAGAPATSRAFAEALLAGDPVGAAGFLAEDVRLLSADGTEVVGRAAARELLAQVTSSEQRLEIRIGRCIAAGTVALATQYWRRGKAGPDGGFESRSVARLVLARGTGRWEIAVASPWE